MRKLYTPLFFILLLTLLPVVGFTQPGIEWQKNYGGSYVECNSYVLPTGDNGYLVTGSSNSNDIDVTGNHGGYDFWILKTDGSGILSWQKSYGGSQDERAHRAIQTSDGGFIIVGYTESSDGNLSDNKGLNDLWILKINSDNSVDWQKNLGGSANDEAIDIIEAWDGSFIIAGTTSSTDGDVQQNKGMSDYWILNIDSTGTLLWQKTFGGSSDDFASSVIQTDDGGFILAGSSYSTDGDIENHYYTSGFADYFIVKLDALGNKEWVGNYGGNTSDILTQLLKTNDGGYLLCGYSDSDNGDVTGNHGAFDAWLIKINSAGGKQWQKSLGGSTDDKVFSISQRTDGDYILSGNTASNDAMVSGNYGVKDIWLVRINESGPLVWQKCLGGSMLEDSYSMALLDDESCIISGHSGSSDYDLTSNHGDLDYWLVKMANLSALETFSFSSSELFSIYPNPIASGNLTIEANGNPDSKYTAYFFDVTGRKIYSINVEGNIPETIDISQFSQGIYFVRFENELMTSSKKFIKQ